MSEKRLLLIESDTAAAAFLGQMFSRAGYTVLSASSGKEGLIEAWRERPDGVVVVGELSDLNGLEVAYRLRNDTRTAQTKIVLLSARDDPQDALAGFQAGADAYIVKRPGADAELLERVRSLLPLETATRPATGPLLKPGKLISFLSAKGGTGTSSLCVNIAHLIAERAAPKRVAVVDLVLPIGSLAPIVGVDATTSNVVTATKLETRELGPEGLQPYLARPEIWNFHLLAGSPDPQTAQELQVQRLEPVIEQLRHMYDFIFFDFGRTLSRISLPFIRASSKIVLVTSPDIATVALTKTVLQFFDTQDVRRHRIALVLNRAVGLEGLSRPEMERELGYAILSLVPHMSGQFAMANNQHVPVTAKFSNDTVSFTLQELAGQLYQQLTQSSEEPAVAM